MSYPSLKGRKSRSWSRCPRGQTLRRNRRSSFRGGNSASRSRSPAKKSTKMPAEHVLVDTNVFVYGADLASPHFPAASAFLDAVAAGSFHGCVTPQVLLEFVSVVTNHAVTSEQKA